MATRRIRRPAAGARILQETGCHASDRADRTLRGAPTVRPRAHRPFLSCNNYANGSHRDVSRRRSEKSRREHRPRCRADRPVAADRAVLGLRRALRLRPCRGPAALLVRDDAAAAGPADRAGAALPVSGLPARAAGSSGTVSADSKPVSGPAFPTILLSQSSAAPTRAGPLHCIATTPSTISSAPRAAAGSVPAPRSPQCRHGPSIATPASGRPPRPR